MIRRHLPAACGLALLLSTSAAHADESKTAPSAEQIAALEKSLSNAALVGHSTDSNNADGKPRPERYELGEVKHLGKGQWLIQARIRYGEHDLPIPLTLPVHWAVDTPVITVDEVAFPGMGTYTARVMIYRDHYAGFWAGKDHGGHLFGVLEHGKENAGAPVDEKSAPGR